MARPTILNQELIDKAYEFLNIRNDINEDLLPTFEGLSLHLNISRETIYAWEESGKGKDATPELKTFSDIAKKLRSSQAEKLLQRALQNKYNPMIAKLLLSKHGYVEKTEQDITTAGEKLPSASVDTDILSQFMLQAKQNTKQ